jgi:biotin transport system substrate-specific component
MATAISARPFISFALPENRAARLAAQFALAFAGTLLLTLSAKTKVVLGPVEMSLQTLAVMLIAASFGLPVFQGTPEKGIGLVYMMGSTGGYLAGFVVMAAIVGWAADRGWDRSFFRFLGALLIAEVVMMAMGFGWLATLIGAEKAWTFGVVPFNVPDLVKVGLAAAIMPTAWALRGR